jgi:UDP-N-acetylglucosamine 3-dehydrogenase
MQVMRVGVIGQGVLGAVHAANLSVIPNARLVAVSVDERSSAVAIDTMRAAGVELVDADSICDEGLVDVVVIATPTDTHAVYAAKAIEAGLSVFCEKPLARNLGDAERIGEMADRRGVKVAVGHVVRYFPEYAAARTLVRDGTLGTPLTARLSRQNLSPAAAGGWYADPKRSGGVVFDMAIHDVDWCLWSFGPAERVYAVRSGAVGNEVASITIRHRSGTIAYIDSSWRSTLFSTFLEISGTAGLHQVDGSTSVGFRLAGSRTDLASYLPPAVDVQIQDDPYVLELKAAFEWFGGGSPPLATVTDACAAIAVVEAAEESIATGAPVALAGETP